MRDYRQTHRVLLVCSPSAADDRHRDQLSALQPAEAGAAERNLVIVEAFERGASRAEGLDIDDADAASLRQAFRIAPGGFAAILIGKDGGEKARWDWPVSASALFHAIDAMPMRRREARDDSRSTQHAS